MRVPRTAAAFALLLLGGCSWLMPGSEPVAAPMSTAEPGVRVIQIHPVGDLVTPQHDPEMVRQFADQLRDDVIAHCLDEDSDPSIVALESTIVVVAMPALQERIGKYLASLRAGENGRL